VISVPPPTGDFMEKKLAELVLLLVVGTLLSRVLRLPLRIVLPVTALYLALIWLAPFLGGSR